MANGADLERHPAERFRSSGPPIFHKIHLGCFPRKQAILITSRTEVRMPIEWANQPAWAMFSADEPISVEDPGKPARVL